MALLWMENPFVHTNSHKYYALLSESRQKNVTSPGLSFSFKSGSTLFSHRLKAFLFFERKKKKFTKIDKEWNGTHYYRMFGKMQPIFFGWLLIFKAYSHNKFQISFIGELQWNTASNYFFLRFCSLSCTEKMEKESDKSLWIGWAVRNLTAIEIVYMWTDIFYTIYVHIYIHLHRIVILLSIYCYSIALALRLRMNSAKFIYAMAIFYVRNFFTVCISHTFVLFIWCTIFIHVVYYWRWMHGDKEITVATEHRQICEIQIYAERESELDKEKFVFILLFFFFLPPISMQFSSFVIECAWLFIVNNKIKLLICRKKLKEERFRFAQRMVEKFSFDVNCYCNLVALLLLIFIFCCSLIW